jgi:hypothetical protein
MLGEFCKNVGAKIVVSDPRMTLVPDEHGINVQPNTASTVPMQAVRNSIFFVENKTYKFSK